jgi:hypothetical protein
MGNRSSDTNNNEQLLSSNNQISSKGENDAYYKEYFKLIKKKMKQTFQENNDNPLNIAISMDKKKFNSSSIVRRISVDNNQIFIHWKTFLTNFLNKQTMKGCSWSKRLEEYIFIKHLD